MKNEQETLNSKISKLAKQNFEASLDGQYFKATGQFLPIGILKSLALTSDNDETVLKIKNAIESKTPVPEWKDADEGYGTEWM